MKAIQYASYGHPPDVVELVDRELAPIDDDEVLIDVEATPIRFTDLDLVRGIEAFRRPLPDVPGGVGVGRIAEKGQKVTKLAIGDRVYLPRVGTWQEQIKVPSAGLQIAPLEGDPIQLSLVNSNLTTAYVLLKDVVDLEPGEWVLQNAANSSCGYYVIRLAKKWGLRTVNVVRRPSLVGELMTWGADAVVVDSPNLAADIAAATGNARIRLAADTVAGEMTGRLGACLCRGGTIAVYGKVSGEPCQIPVPIWCYKQLRLVGVLGGLQHSTRSPQEVAATYEVMSRLVTEGYLSANIAGVYPFDRIKEALAHAVKTGDERHGKVILVPR